MAFGLKKKIVRVEFFDSVTEKMIGYDEMNRKSLPEDFKVATWVTIAGDKYKVEQVLPDSIKKAIKKGTMTVHLRLEEKAATVPDVKVKAKAESLFRHASKADHSPRIRGKRADMKLLEMAHADWRNLELMLGKNRVLVLEAFDKIKDFGKGVSTIQDGKTFFHDQYERGDVIMPLRGQKMAIENLKKDFFQFSVDLEGLTFMGETGIADQAFAMRCPSGICLYGQEFEDVIRYLALRKPADNLSEMLKADIASVAQLMQKKDLILVDWETLKIIEANEADLHTFFFGEIDADPSEQDGDSTISFPNSKIASQEVATPAVEAAPLSVANETIAAKAQIPELPEVPALEVEIAPEFIPQLEDLPEVVHAKEKADSDRIKSEQEDAANADKLADIPEMLTVDASEVEVDGAEKFVVEEAESAVTPEIEAVEEVTSEIVVEETHSEEVVVVEEVAREPVVEETHSEKVVVVEEVARETVVEEMLSEEVEVVEEVASENDAKEEKADEDSDSPEKEA